LWSRTAILVVAEALALFAMRRTPRPMPLCKP
jgi:hypothetical protein